MTDKDEVKLIYTGSPVEARYIQKLLEESGIGTLFRNTLNESLIAGWASGSPEDAVRLFVAEHDYGKAMQIIEDFKGSKE
jgi:hypothetical protein